MAGHSKWANIKHKKQSTDAKRGKIFNKLAKELLIAAKLGGLDESSNPRLRTAIHKAKQANMPRSNIDKAINKGAGNTADTFLEECMYEAYGPSGIAIIIEIMTDKKSRTLPEIKNILSKNNGNLGSSGSVSYLFDYKGIICIENTGSISSEELLDKAIELGAEDVHVEEELFIIETKKEIFHEVLTQLVAFSEEKQFSISESSVKYIPKECISINEEKYDQVLKLLDVLEEHEDVQNIYSNLEFKP